MIDALYTLNLRGCWTSQTWCKAAASKCLELSQTVLLWCLWPRDAPIQRATARWNRNGYRCFSFRTVSACPSETSHCVVEQWMLAPCPWWLHWEHEGYQGYQGYHSLWMCKSMLLSTNRTNKPHDSTVRVPNGCCSFGHGWSYQLCLSETAAVETATIHFLVKNLLASFPIHLESSAPWVSATHALRAPWFFPHQTVAGPSECLGRWAPGRWGEPKLFLQPLRHLGWHLIKGLL